MRSKPLGNVLSELLEYFRAVDCLFAHIQFMISFASIPLNTYFVCFVCGTNYKMIAQHTDTIIRFFTFFQSTFGQSEHFLYSFVTMEAAKIHSNKILLCFNRNKCILVQKKNATFHPSQATRRIFLFGNRDHWKFFIGKFQFIFKWKRIVSIAVVFFIYDNYWNKHGRS